MNKADLGQPERLVFIYLEENKYTQPEVNIDKEFSDYTKESKERV